MVFGDLHQHHSVVWYDNVNNTIIAQWMESLFLKPLAFTIVSLAQPMLTAWMVYTVNTIEWFLFFIQFFFPPQKKCIRDRLNYDDDASLLHVRGLRINSLNHLTHSLTDIHSKVRLHPGKRTETNDKNDQNNVANKIFMNSNTFNIQLLLFFFKHHFYSSKIL